MLQGQGQCIPQQVPPHAPGAVALIQRVHDDHGDVDDDLKGQHHHEDSLVLLPQERLYEGPAYTRACHLDGEHIAYFVSQYIIILNTYSNI